MTCAFIRRRLWNGCGNCTALIREELWLDMGMGKTRQVGAFIAGLIESAIIKRVLIVLPPTLIGQWVSELCKVGLEEHTYLFRDLRTRVSILDNVIEHGGILLCSQALIPDNWMILNRAKSWDYLIFDEAHKLQDPKTDLYLNLKKIHVEHRILLTGTPMQNTLENLHALLSFCCPKVFGSLEDFVKEFSAPLIDGNYRESSNEQIVLSSKTSTKLRDAISPYILRRMKEEISSLPEKAEITVWLELSPFQQIMYRTVLKSKLINREEKGAVLVASTLLRKICNHPEQLIRKKSNEDCQEHLEEGEGKLLKDLIMRLERRISREKESADGYYCSCKINFILKLLEKLYGHHKVLIFSQTCEMLDAIEEAISRKEYKYFRIDGGTKASERQKIVDEFKVNAEIPVFLLSLRVGGVGIDLPVATRSIIFYPSWNPSIDNQCADRTYRIGQEQNVVIYRLIATGTVEEYVYETQLFKDGLFKVVTEEKEFNRYVFKRRNDILSISSEGFSHSRLQRRLTRESMKEDRSEELQEELNMLLELGYGLVSIHNRLFSETIALPTLSVDGALTNKKVNRAYSRRVDRDDAINRADLALTPRARARANRCEVASAPCLDSDQLAVMKANKITQLEKEIERYKKNVISIGPQTPDRGKKLKDYIEKLSEELSDLKSDTNAMEGPTAV